MIPQIKTLFTFRSKPKHISNSPQKITVQSSQARLTPLHAVPQLHALPNLNEKKAEHLFSQLQNKEIGIVEALEELRTFPQELHGQILREAQILFQALPDDQQETVLNNPTARNTLGNLSSHPIFKGNHFNFFKYLPPNFTNKGEV